MGIFLTISIIIAIIIFIIPDWFFKPMDLYFYNSRPLYQQIIVCCCIGVLCGVVFVFAGWFVNQIDPWLVSLGV